MTKIKQIFCVVISVFVSLAANGQLLYEISGRSAPKSYLLATNKYCNLDFLDTIPNVLQTLGRCQTVITEMSIDSVDLPEILSAATILPDSATIYSLYSSDEISRLNAAFASTLFLTLDQMARLRPSALCEMYRDQLMRQWLKYDDKRNADLFFQTIAVQTGKRAIALDSPNESMYMLFEREPMHWQQKELIKIIDNPEKDINLERTILHLYKMGQLTQIAYEISSPDNTSTLSFSDYEVFAKRNIEWVKRLESHLAVGNVFIALDAKYLGGEKGLIALLRAKGYKVKAVNRRSTAKEKIKDKESEEN